MSPSDLVRVRVWDRVVRVTHWAIVGSLAVLAVTGILIGHPMLVAPGEARGHFITGTVKVVHSYGAIVFTLAVLSRILWMFIGRRRARWTELVPIDRARRAGMFETLRFYTFFRRNPPPFVGHNPLAGATYVAVFALYLVMIATGLGLYAVSAHVDSPMRAFGFLLTPFGGAQNARWVHHVVMWLLLAFSVHHIYSAMLVAGIEKNGTLDSIVTGNKWVPRDLAEREARR